MDEFCEEILKVKEVYESNPDIKLGDQLCLMTYIHLCISLVYRVSYFKGVNLSRQINLARDFMDENFPQWRNLEYLSFGYCRKRGFKHLGLWATSALYKT